MSELDKAEINNYHEIDTIENLLKIMGITDSEDIENSSKIDNCYNKNNAPVAFNEQQSPSFDLCCQNNNEEYENTSNYDYVEDFENEFSDAIHESECGDNILTADIEKSFPTCTTFESCLDSYYPLLLTSSKQQNDSQKELDKPSDEFIENFYIQSEINKLKHFDKAQIIQSCNRLSLTAIYQNSLTYDHNQYIGKHLILRIILPLIFLKDKIIGLVTDPYEKYNCYRFCINNSIFSENLSCNKKLLNKIFKVGTVLLIVDPEITKNEQNQEPWLEINDYSKIINTFCLNYVDHEYLKYFGWISLLEWRSKVFPIYSNNSNHLVPYIVPNMNAGYVKRYFYEVGKYCYKIGYYKLALVYFERAYTKDKKNYKYFLLIANTNFKLGLYESVIQFAKQSIKHLKYILHSVSLIVLSYLGLKDIDKAILTINLFEKELNQMEIFDQLKKVVATYILQKKNGVCKYFPDKQFAEFSLPIKIILSKKRYKVVACKDIHKGEIIMSSRAIEIVNHLDSKENFELEVENFDGIERLKKILVLKIANSVLNNPNFAETIYELPKTFQTLNKEEESGPLNTKYSELNLKMIDDICNRNLFYDRFAFSICKQDKSYTFVGLWSIPSYMNNSCCDNNAFYYFSEKMMYIKACHEIKSGQEITLPKIDPELTYLGRRKMMEIKYGKSYRCFCSLCLLEEDEEIDTVIKRKVIIEKINEIVSVDKSSLSKSLIEEYTVSIRKLFVELYRLRKDVPFLNYPIFYLFLEMAKLERLNQNYGRYIEILDLGFKCLEMTDSKTLNIIRYQAVISHLISKELLRKGQKDKSEAWRKKSNEYLELINADSRIFEEFI